mmetsp:Transcript_16422/g.18579  ORF Transcript_16422/g.18579 Transcript_16422/m.18579 type:complete len:313 (+) Transcript_16422:482-1420(+)|eukprot:CAMPEP_0184071882 /NCGR_PEP_ID=MMETSP0957-20130417/56637_1 /TAXON_ID=627963 /ORGANISM="Aplanochytrium sp, Strain PBS07" /LENGTH=312 /DNA_ID=CAMNT_0026372629 /DNA_START=446 /DNA_END=1384 /DNA_ORIENTATION=+
MQEQHRVVRAVSEDTERPYFRIRYRLSVSGREMLQDALSGNLAPTGQFFDAMEVDESKDFDDEKEFSNSRRYMKQQRRSKSVIVGGSKNRTFRSTDENLDDSFQMHVETSDLPTTPRSQHKIPENVSFSWSSQEFKDTAESDTKPTSTEPIGVKRTNSMGMLDMEVNRYGSPVMPLHQLRYEMKREPVMAKGLVTCLNSKNVKKYTIGQRYRRGVIVGIDEEQGKIIVLHKNMPAGALSLVRSGNAKRYEKGYSMEDAQGRRLGTVHAIDRLQDIVVINTTTADNDLTSNASRWNEAGYECQYGSGKVGLCA